MNQKKPRASSFSHYKGLCEDITELQAHYGGDFALIHHNVEMEFTRYKHALCLYVNSSKSG